MPGKKRGEGGFQPSRTWREKGGGWELTVDTVTIGPDGPEPSPEEPITSAQPASAQLPTLTLPKHLIFEQPVRLPFLQTQPQPHQVPVATFTHTGIPRVLVVGRRGRSEEFVEFGGRLGFICHGLDELVRVLGEGPDDVRPAVFEESGGGGLVSRRGGSGHLVPGVL